MEKKEGKEKIIPISMDKKELETLLNTITTKKFVNLHFGGKIVQDKHIEQEIVEKIEEGRGKSYFIAVPIEKISVSKERAAAQLKEIINDTLLGQGFGHWIRQGVSMSSVLKNLSENLDRPASMVFYQFKDFSSKKEKHILTSIRKFIEEENSPLLKILLVSRDEVEKWELAPDSNIDGDRHVQYFPK